MAKTEYVVAPSVKQASRFAEICNWQREGRSSWRKPDGTRVAFTADPSRAVGPRVHFASQI